MSENGNGDGNGSGKAAAIKPTSSVESASSGVETTSSGSGETASPGSTASASPAATPLEDTELEHLTGWNGNSDDSTTEAEDISLLDDHEHVAPQRVKSQRPLSQNPIARAIVTLMGVGSVGGTLLHFVFGNAPNTPGVSPTTANIFGTRQTDPKDEEIRHLQELVGQQQGQLATVRQEQGLSNLKFNARKPPKVVPTRVAYRPTSAPPVRTQSVSAVPTAARYRPARGISRVAVPRLLTSAQMQPQQQQKLDPMQQWQMASNLGNYGTVGANDNSVAPNPNNNWNSPTASNPNQWTTASYSQPQSQSQSSTVTQPQWEQSSPTNQSVSETSVSAYNTGNGLKIGTTAKATLQTEVALAGNHDNNVQNYVIILEEPLKSSNDTVVLPEGSELVAKVSSASSVGREALVQMSVTQVFVNENGQMIEKSIPPDSLLIQGSGGKELRASAKKGSSIGRFLGTTLLSGVSQAVNSLNNPSTQTIFGGSGYQTTIRRNKPNMLNEFAAGTTSALANSAMSRVRQGLVGNESRSSVFTLKQGTKVQVYVNQSFSL
jgi:hypothetical protein